MGSSKLTEIPEDAKLPVQDFSTQSDGKTVEELKELAMMLKGKIVSYQTLATKAQGALEVMLQLIPKQEVEEMIAQENKENGEVINDTETTD